MRPLGVLVHSANAVEEKTRTAAAQVSILSILAPVSGGCLQGLRYRPGQSGEAQAFPIQDGSLTAEVPQRRSIPQSTLRLKYSSTNEHSPHRYGSPKKGFYRLRPIALQGNPGQSGEAYKVLSQDRRRAVDYVRPSICTLVEE